MRERLESLFRACEAGDRARAEQLIGGGEFDVDGNNYWSADIDPRGWQRSPLHIAIAHGHLELARWLLEQGANPDSRTKFGDTPLTMILDAPLPPHWMAAATLLLAHGADPTAQNLDGDSALARAQRNPAAWPTVRPLLEGPV